MPGMFRAPSMQLGRIKNPQGFFSSNIGMGIGVGPLSFTPAKLFAKGEQGVWYDSSDFSTLFQDSAGTVPVTTVGQPVGLMLDKSGRGNHLSQTTTTQRPILQQDAGGFYYLAFDGIDDGLVSATGLTLPATSAWFAGLNSITNNWAPFYAPNNQITYYCFVPQSGSSSVTHGASIGSPADYVDGVIVNPDTRAAIFTAFSDGNNHVAESRPLDTTLMTQIGMFNYPSAVGAGRMYQYILCTDANASTYLSRIRTYIGLKMGVAL